MAAPKALGPSRGRLKSAAGRLYRLLGNWRLLRNSPVLRQGSRSRTEPGIHRIRGDHFPGRLTPRT